MGSAIMMQAIRCGLLALNHFEHALHSERRGSTSYYFDTMKIETGSPPTMVQTNAVDEMKSPSQRLDPTGRPLFPTPTNDKYDPLNWSMFQKSVCIFIVIYSYFMLTYFTTTPIPSFAFLQEQLNIDYSQVSWSFALPCLGLAAGPLIAGALADTYGRRPILIASTALAVVASGCTAIKTINFGGYMAARFFQGLGAGPSANIGLVIINDISWQHERGLRVGMWTIAANCGTVLGGVCKFDISSSMPLCGR